MRVPRKKAISPISRLKLVAMATSLTDPETNTRMNIYTNMSTIPENLVKIAVVIAPNDR